MKVATCTICRLENNYLIEFVDYYKSIGIDHMYIYDNNVPGTENVIDVLKKYVDKGFVTVIDYQDQQKYPMNKGLIEAYNDCWNSYKDQYDWILFLDNDEFLTLLYDNNIKAYLGRECFEDANIIRINWLCFDDNNLIYYEDKPLQERFTHLCGGTKEFSGNLNAKSIIKTSTKDIDFYTTNAAHKPRYNESYIVVDAGGKEIIEYKEKNRPTLYHTNFDLAYYKHYRMKTIDEYVHNKIAKLKYQGYTKVNFTLDEFFKYNEYSKEKEDYYNEHTNVNLNKKENVVYTVIIGEYDKLNDPEYITEGWDYICLTDNKNLKSDIWQIVDIESEKYNFDLSHQPNDYWYFENRDQYLNRYLKILIPEKISSNYNFSIYIDGNITICGDLNEFKKTYIETEDKDQIYLWALKHASRHCIYEEIEACRKQHKDSDYNLDRLLFELLRRQYPENLGLSQNSILCRYHKNSSDYNYMNRIAKSWWRKIVTFTVRDQCTLYWVLYQNKLLDHIKLLFDRNDKRYFRTTNKHN